MHEKDDTMLNDFSFLVFYHPCCQNVVKCSQNSIEEMLILRGLWGVPTGFDSLIPCWLRSHKVYKNGLCEVFFIFLILESNHHSNHLIINCLFNLFFSLSFLLNVKLIITFGCLYNFSFWQYLYLEWMP